MRALRVVIAVLALSQAGYMVFDGIRALTMGDYLTPSSGEYAGQLGPWTYVVGAVGIPPRSTGMKLFFVVFGAAWLVAVAQYLRRTPRSRAWMAGFSIASLWYLMFGTMTGLVTLALLAIEARRAA